MAEGSCRVLVPTMELPRSDIEALDPSYQTSQVKRDEEWEKIKSLRMEIWSLRSKMHTLRQELREMEKAKSVADDRYFLYVRMHNLGISTSISKETLEELFRDCEQARDELGPLEDDTTLLEDHIWKQEFDLEKLEEKFYQREVPASPSLATHYQHSLAPLPPVSGQGKYETMDQEYHPLVMTYLSKLGDIDLLQEQLDDHIEQKARLEYQKNCRLRFGLQLSASDEAWLDSFDQCHNTLLQQLKEAESGAEILKQACLDSGLPQDFENWENNANARHKTSNYAKFLLLLNDYKKPPDFGDQDQNFDGIQETCINRWLLYQLRSSPLQSHLLPKIFLEESGPGDNGKVKWTPKVLELWSNSGWRKRYRRSSGLWISSVPPRLAALFCIFGKFLLPVAAIPTEPPPVQTTASKSPSNESLLMNGGVVIALSLAYTAIVFCNRLSTVTIIVPVGIFLLGMDDNVSSWQLTFCCIFSGKLVAENLKEKLESLPKSGGLTALCITILGILSACAIAYFVAFERRYEFEGRYANPWIFGTVIALSTTMLVSEFWINAFYRTGLAKRIEAGEYNESILRVVKDVLAELFLTLVTQIPGFRAFGINWERARDQRLGPAPPNHPRQMFSEAAAIEEGFVIRQQ